MTVDDLIRTSVEDYEAALDAQLERITGPDWRPGPGYASAVAAAMDRVHRGARKAKRGDD